MSKPVEDLAAITAAILVGGLGTRLRPVVADRPKVLAPVRGRPFLEYLFDQLRAAGIRSVVLCNGYLGEQLCARWGAMYENLALHYSQETAPLGTAGALRLVLPLLQSDPVLVLNGDSFCQVQLPAFYAWYLRCQADAALVATSVPDAARYGKVVFDEEARVVGFEEKGQAAGPGWINAGIYLLRRPLVAEIPENRMVSLERELFPRWIGRGFYAYQSDGGFLDIGTPASYTRAERFFC